MKDYTYHSFIGGVVWNKVLAIHCNKCAKITHCVTEKGNIDIFLLEM